MSNTGNNATKSTAHIVTSDSPAKLELTAYQSGLAVFREKRVVALVEGANRVFLSGLPAQIDPQSLTVVSVDGSGQFKMSAVSHRPASLSAQTILLASIGATVTFIEQTNQGEIRKTGVLKHLLGNQVVLEQADGRTLLQPLTNKFELSGPLPAGLSALSSLLMEAKVSAAGDFGINVLYEAGGIEWSPRYEAFYDAAGEKLTRFACQVDLTNNTGRKLEDAVFKLIAGYNQGAPRRNMAPKGGVRMAAAMSLESAGGSADFGVEAAAVESVGEQKMYTLPEAITVEEGETKQTALVFAENVPVTPEYYLGAGYYAEGVRSEDLQKLPVNIRLRVKNDAASNLGSALPPGQVRVLEPDSSGALQKTDSSAVSAHVASDEPFTLELRNPCRDLKATRRLTFQHTDPEPPAQSEQPDHPVKPQMSIAGPESCVVRPGDRPEVLQDSVESAGRRKDKKPAPRFREEERETVVHNYKGKDVTVLVHETIPHNAEVLSQSHDFAEQAQSSGLFRVNVPAKGSVKVTYRIKYQVN